MQITKNGTTPQAVKSLPHKIYYNRMILWSWNSATTTRLLPALETYRQFLRVTTNTTATTTTQQIFLNVVYYYYLLYKYTFVRFMYLYLFLIY